MERDTHRLGYRAVDADAHVPVLLGTMDATGSWAATIELRAWERAGLGLVPGERVLDVGCGLGDAALALASDLGPGGELVGLDASAEMLAVARDRATAVECPTRWVQGDAHALPEPDGSFDVARSERTLQWLADPAAAVAEVARVLRPGGRLGLIDTDWSSLRLDVGAPAVAAAVEGALRTERRRPSNVGRRLGALAEAAGFEVLDATAATQRWTGWDPDASPAPDGCFSMASLADDLVDAGQLAPGDTAGFVATVEDAARAGRFAMALTMHAVVARRR